MKFISRAKRKALEEKLATLDASSDEAKEIRTKLGWGDPAPVVEASPPPPPPVEEKPVPKKTASKAKTTNKTGLFGKKTSTKK
tara:strand:- start:36963 stop:37211 length:249 start_codon:yes stop_codon:yes gene_type:complete